MFYICARYDVLVACVIAHTIYGLCHSGSRFRRARHRALSEIRHHRNRHRSRDIRKGRHNHNHRKFHLCGYELSSTVVLPSYQGSHLSLNGKLIYKLASSHSACAASGYCHHTRCGDCSSKIACCTSCCRYLV